MAQTFDLTGEWIVDDGNSLYKVRLSQIDNRVSGVYDLQEGSIDGVVESNVFKLHWDQPANLRAGTSELVIARDGRRMQGTWYYDPMPYGVPLAGGGQWTFRR